MNVKKIMNLKKLKKNEYELFLISKGLKQEEAQQIIKRIYG